MSESTTTLQKNTIILDIRCKKPTQTKRGSLNDVEVDSDKDSVNLTKEVFRSDHFKKARLEEANVKILIGKYSLKSPYRAGMFLLPTPTIDPIVEALKKAKERFNKHADAFCAEWDEIVADAKRRLRSQFRGRDYPSAREMRRKFDMGWRFLQLETPDKAVLGEVLYKQELQKAQDTWKAAEGEVIDALRTSMAELIGHLADQLKPKADGSKGRLSASVVDNVNDFLENFSKRNVLNDEELKTLVEKAQKVLKGRTVEAFKSTDSRVLVSNGLKRVQKSLDGLITSSKRKMNFDDDDE